MIKRKIRFASDKAATPKNVLASFLEEVISLEGTHDQIDGVVIMGMRKAGKQLLRTSSMDLRDKCFMLQVFNASLNSKFFKG